MADAVANAITQQNQRAAQLRQAREAREARQARKPDTPSSLPKAAESRDPGGGPSVQTSSRNAMAQHHLEKLGHIRESLCPPWPQGGKAETRLFVAIAEHRIDIDTAMVVLRYRTVLLIARELRMRRSLSGSRDIYMTREESEHTANIDKERRTFVREVHHLIKKITLNFEYAAGTYFPHKETPSWFRCFGPFCAIATLASPEFLEDLPTTMTRWIKRMRQVFQRVLKHSYGFKTWAPENGLARVAVASLTQLLNDLDAPPGPNEPPSTIPRSGRLKRSPVQKATVQDGGDLASIPDPENGLDTDLSCLRWQEDPTLVTVGLSDHPIGASQRAEADADTSHSDQSAPECENSDERQRSAEGLAISVTSASPVPRQIPPVLGQSLGMPLIPRLPFANSHCFDSSDRSQSNSGFEHNDGTSSIHTPTLAELGRVDASATPILAELGRVDASATPTLAELGRVDASAAPIIAADYQFAFDPPDAVQDIGGHLWLQALEMYQQQGFGDVPAALPPVMEPSPTPFLSTAIHAQQRDAYVSGFPMAHSQSSAQSIRQDASPARRQPISTGQQRGDPDCGPGESNIAPREPVNAADERMITDVTPESARHIYSVPASLSNTGFTHDFSPQQHGGSQYDNITNFHVYEDGRHDTVDPYLAHWPDDPSTRQPPIPLWTSAELNVGATEQNNMMAIPLSGIPAMDHSRHYYGTGSDVNMSYGFALDRPNTESVWFDGAVAPAVPTGWECSPPRLHSGSEHGQHGGHHVPTTLESSWNVAPTAVRHPHSDQGLELNGNSAGTAPACGTPACRECWAAFYQAQVMPETYQVPATRRPVAMDSVPGIWNSLLSAPSADQMPNF
jgi:hypothetical protein